MNPDTGGDAEDWFAKFEREAREAAEKRAAESDAVDPLTSSPPPVAPQLANPFDAPPAAPVQPSAPLWEPLPTQAMGRVEPEPTQAMGMVEPEPTEATQALVPAPLRPPGAEEPGSALDSLFGDERFREYESTLGPDPSNSPFAARSRSQELVHVPGKGTGGPPDRHFGRPQKVLLGVGGGLLAILALIALFLLGTRLPDILGPAPAVSTPTPTPTPEITALPIGPVEPGIYDWDDLLGGECLDPYDAELGAWAEEYSVVDCAEPHAGQMVYRAWFPAVAPDAENPQVGPPGDPFPGVEALQAQISLLCSAPGVVDLAAAGAYSDIQIEGSYPVSEEQWDADPSFYCFVSRASGEPLTTSVAIPRQPVEPVQPAPEG